VRNFESTQEPADGCQRHLNGLNGLRVNAIFFADRFCFLDWPERSGCLFFLSVYLSTYFGAVVTTWTSIARFELTYIYTYIHEAIWLSCFPNFGSILKISKQSNWQSWLRLSIRFMIEWNLVFFGFLQNEFNCVLSRDFCYFLSLNSKILTSNFCGQINIL
jgi:hypothetical protein